MIVRSADPGPRPERPFGRRGQWSRALGAGTARALSHAGGAV